MKGNGQGAQTAEGGGLNLGEIYYTLFRHKWLILFFSLAGMVGSAAIYFGTQRTYESQAKLLVPYIFERRGIDPGETGEQSRPIVTGGSSVIEAEIEILTSLDLAKQAAEVIGPERVLPTSGVGDATLVGLANRITAVVGLGNAVHRNSNASPVMAAAAFIGKNLSASPKRGSSVIEVSLQHPDPKIAQEVLKALIDVYFRKHVEIHEAAGPMGIFVKEQRDKYREELARTEEELRVLKQKYGVVSVEESRRKLIEQASSIKQELLDYEAELAERRAVLGDAWTTGNGLPVTNEIVIRQEVPAPKLEEYRSLGVQLEHLRKREQELLFQFTENHSMVRKIRQLISEVLERCKVMEGAFPELKQINEQHSLIAEKSGEAAMSPLKSILALQAKVGVRKDQFAQTESNLVAIELVEPRIAELEKKRERVSTSLRSYQASLDRAVNDAARGADGVSNIAVVQEPSPGRPATSKLLKKVGAVLAAGFGGGIGLAFLLEMILRQSIRHSGHVERRLGLPLLTSIPTLSRKSLVSPGIPPGDGLAVEAHGHQFRSYAAALRDRIITHFEVRNMTHKPKMVAVTSCSKGAGVSSIAAGLAETLSETGDGNVLLVDMNLEKGAVHPFFRGKPAIGIADAFDANDRHPAHVQENLYAVSAGATDQWSSQAMQKSFRSLFPRFKASDYDYIIFDMPSVTQTSITPRLSSYMDLVLFVVEAEKTSIGVAAKATELLRESGVSVGAVINRKHNFVPRWLLDEF